MDLNQQELLSQLRQIDEYDFEHLVADVWGQQGWQTTVTSGSKDRGIDVIAEKSSPFRQKHLIQAKRYSAGNKISSPDIQQYSSLRQQEDDVDAVVVVTTSSFTPEAERTAQDLNVKLIDGEELCNIIVDSNSQDIVYDCVDDFIDELKYTYRKALEMLDDKDVPHIKIRFSRGDDIDCHLTISFSNGCPLYNIAGLDSKEVIISEYIAKEYNLSVVSYSENKKGEMILLKENEERVDSKVVKIAKQVLSDVYQIDNKNKCEIDLES
jgi:hypothetical protein